MSSEEVVKHIALRSGPHFVFSPFSVWTSTLNPQHLCIPVVIIEFPVIDAGVRVEEDGFCIVSPEPKPSTNSVMIMVDIDIVRELTHKLNELIKAYEKDRKELF